MKKSIFLQNQKIEYKLCESARARCLRITVYPGGELTATLPRGMGLEKLENFLRQKADWILRKIILAKKRKPSVFLPKASRREYLVRKKEALAVAKEKLEYFGKIYGLHPAKISIRNQKTRWGSCSRNGNISLNYRIIHLPEKYRDYIIVHELCHLKVFNHSKKFWDLVAVTIPNFKAARKAIRNL